MAFLNDADILPLYISKPYQKGSAMADIHIDSGIISITSLNVQDVKAADILAAYPPERRAEIMRRAIKIGLGYLKGGEND